jgi:hypothetical protein
MCANCGNATSESLEVAKVFRHVDASNDGSPDTFSMARVMVPFCPPCAAQHRSELRQVTSFRRFAMTLHGRSMLSAIGLGAIALSIVFMTTRSTSATLLLWSVAALFGLLAWVCVRAAYSETEHLATPPPTSISSAFDFTDDHAQRFEREHRTVTLRNPTFADAFLARNGSHVWNPEDPANRKAAQTRNLLVNAAIAVFLIALAWLILKSLR